mmetsp:Transcript_56576/g.83070  ORF Transcript_56576/g.83070 Transcript_56576/m.83070 type:complete len:82 (+) Transcript_56576:3-248(+)
MARAPFVYMFPVESAGDESEWQLSWVRTIEMKERLEILKEAFLRISLAHLEDAARSDEEISRLKEEILRLKEQGTGVSASV